MCVASTCVLVCFYTCMYAYIYQCIDSFVFLEVSERDEAIYVLLTTP